MPNLTIGEKTFAVEAGKRLVLAIKENGTNIGHRCGGYAKCTTCRVEITAGDIDTITQAEYDKLKERDLLGKYRLSCQLTCDHDMSVNAIMTLESEVAWQDTGPEPDETVTPEAIWLPLDTLE